MILIFVSSALFLLYQKRYLPKNQKKPSTRKHLKKSDRFILKNTRSILYETRSIHHNIATHVYTVCSQTTEVDVMKNSKLVMHNYRSFRRTVWAESFWSPSSHRKFVIFFVKSYSYLFGGFLSIQLSVSSQVSLISHSTELCGFYQLSSNFSNIPSSLWFARLKYLTPKLWLQHLNHLVWLYKGYTSPGGKLSLCDFPAVTGLFSDNVLKTDVFEDLLDVQDQWATNMLPIEVFNRLI